MLKALIILLATVPVLIMAGLLTWQQRRLDADARREAITTELRNAPAASLEARREAIYDKQLNRILSAMVSGLVGGMLILSRRAEVDLNAWGLIDTLIVLFIVGVGLYYGRQIIRDMRPTRQLKQAIRAEQASAQELAASLAGDNRIIHDIQCGDFNIDHVVITPAGVFAVETKSRLKPPAGNGRPTVKYDGKSLAFPSWSESKPIEQADRQARWLANYLREATGEAFPVVAVLSLPGWWIERIAPIAPNMVQVINPKNSRWLLLPDKKPPRLEAAAIKRAIFAIEKLAQAKAE